MENEVLSEYPGSVLSYQGPVPGLLDRVYPKQLGLSSIAWGLVWGDFIRPCTNGVLLLHKIASAAFLNKLQTTSKQSASYIGHHTKHEVWRFLMTKPDVGSTPSLLATEPGSTAGWDGKRISSHPQSCLSQTRSGCPSK